MCADAKQGVTYTTGGTSEDAPAPVAVSSTDELLEAIGDAEDGDTIFIADTCVIPADTVIGSTEKRLNLMRAETLQDGEMFICGSSATFENLTIDGNGASARTFWISGDVSLSGLTIQNSGGGALEVRGGALTIESCSFMNNTAFNGGHIWIIADATAAITNSTFVAGTAMGSAGAI